ncbi:MAG: hypothetical protein K2Q06_08690, partial [Parvularculaceae bacterium]|nr:hypothetical protein [Parvularculaceae bacterium]
MADGSRASSPAPASTARRLVLQIFADSADAALAARVADALYAEGHAVRGGAFDPDDVDAVIVIWSEAAIASPAMLAAAAAASVARPLVPLSVGGVDPQAASFPEPMPLDGWSGDRADPRWRFVVDELRLAALRGAAERVAATTLAPPQDDEDFEEAVETTLAAPQRVAPPPRPTSPRFRWSSRATALAAGGAALFSALVLLASYPVAPPPERSASNGVPPNLAHATPSVSPRPPALEPAPIPLEVEVEVEAAAAPAQETAPAETTPQTPRRKPAPPEPPVKTAKEEAPAVDPLAALIVETAGGGGTKRAASFRDCALCPPMLRVTPGRLA